MPWADNAHWPAPVDALAPRYGSESDLDNACDRLIRAANDAGGTDNITAILCRIERL